MITIKYTDSCIKATGHANFAEPGKDVVCAAVSILLQTLELRGKATKSKGNMIVHTEDKDALQLIVEGLRLISSNYPENVEVIGC